MSYNYAPPPPPPPPGPQSYGHQPPAYGQPAHRGGGSQPRGRGGSYNGGGAYNSGRPEYQQATQSPYPYSGYSPSTPAPYGSESGYQTQWQPEHGQAPPPHAAHPGGHVPSPISSTNYHPNYAQPGYAQQPQYSHPGYGPPSQPQYGSPYPSGPAPVSPPQWAGQASPPQQPYSSGRPHRGGYQNDHRGSARGGPMGHSDRLGYRPEPPHPPVNNTYGGQYQESRPPAQYPPPGQPYQYAPPPPPPAQTLAPPRQDTYYTPNGRRGGGGRGGFRDGGRGGRQQFQSRNDKSGSKKPNHVSHDDSAKPDQIATGKKKKRKVNTLGLTPGNASASEEEDDDGEEKALSELMGNELLEITDLAAFLAERKKRYPTKARIEEKKAAELAAQAEKEEETSRLERERERLKRRLEKVESSIKRKREQQDEGDEMRASSDEDDDDDEPEVQTSRAAAAAGAGAAGAGAGAGAANPTSTPAPPPPPAKKADITKHCKYYSTGGSCGKKGKCRFVHDPAVREAAIREKEANNGQLTIKQRLILNDKDQEDLSILESIQYIREKGLAKTGSGLGQASASSRPAEAAPKNGPAKVGGLPAKPPSLPPTPAKREGGMPKNPSASASNGGPERLYNGWNLLGYGGTGIKPEDLP